MAEHIIKCAPAYFDAIERGDKTFEVRRDDRGYQKGDTLILQRTKQDSPWEVEWDSFFDPPLGERRRARKELRCTVAWVLTGGQFGIEGGYVVMSIKDVAPPSSTEASHEQ